MPGRIRLTAEDGHMSSAYFAGSADAGIGLVVVQEMFGVDSHIGRVCEALSGETGHAVIAPALFDRVEAGVEPERVQVD